MEPVLLEDQLILEEKMFHDMGKSLSKLKRRIHLTEMTLNVRPPDNEIVEVEAWNDKLNELISRRDVMAFPNIKTIKRAINEERNTKALASEKMNEERENSKQRHKILLQESLKKLQNFRANRTYGPTNFFGGKDEGEELGTIKNYAGNYSVY